MSEQEQSVDRGELVIQSGRDTHVQQGISPSDMRQILESLAAQFPAQLAAAREIVEARLAEFEKRILIKFTDRDKTDSRAFSDPDFQYVLRSSQHAYARLGDDTVRDVLIDLIAHRSKQQERNRLSLTLNAAVDTAAVLTKNEFAELSLCYLLKYTIHNGVGNMDSFVAYFQKHISPLLPDISKEHASYLYIEAQSCGNLVPPLIRSDIHEIVGLFRNRYGGIFSSGFDRAQLEERLPEGRKDVLDSAGLIIACLNDSTKLQIKASNRDVFINAVANVGMEEAQINNVWDMFASTMWAGEEFISLVEERIPEFRNLVALWDNQAISTLNLTTVGIAIGHSNLVRVAGLDADLAIWIK